ncbi:hypothetical protein CYLTODRAFT_401045 [Cylindrobasidium torrendii FP15055 ss-10]|uniref:Gti1/Pac2 family-domain-containing protein n=1 Tax=Cylindrobasidium torrendii FP15055 ss-10 TaxID=1314674 RepID=A0A0D7B660_9AGAR|nr:hypothetical protein CYLTODRAFT_401045 [Cylindrobasidium torrendii FP15055 ss-10]
MAVARAVARLPFHGHVETTMHALRLIQAAREGVIPRITRRLNDNERRTMIKSGAVFVFSVEESRIKRWTDGLLWSPSRIVGNFLVYREVTERTFNRGGSRRPYPVDASLFEGSRNSISWNNDDVDKPILKPGGLVKKTITVTVDGADLHLISYYTMKDLNEGFLDTPTSRPDIMTLDIPPEIFRLSNLRVPPKVEMGTDGIARIV